MVLLLGMGLGDKASLFLLVESGIPMYGPVTMGGALGACELSLPGPRRR